MYSLGGNDKNGKSKLGRTRRRSHILANTFQVVMELQFREECCAALGAQSLDSNEIDYYFFETFVCVGDILVILVKCCVETIGLIFYWIFVKLIYPFFVGFLVAAIGWIQLVGLAWCALGGGAKLAWLVIISCASCSACTVGS